jgi:hypothetical protein
LFAALFNDLLQGFLGLDDPANALGQGEICLLFGDVPPEPASCCLVTGSPQFKSGLLPESQAVSGKIMQTYLKLQFESATRSGSRDNATGWRHTMKKFLLGTVGLLALGMGSPALPQIWP